MKRLLLWFPPIVAFMWLCSLELAFDEHGDVVPWIGFVFLSVALGAQLYALWARGATRLQKTLGIAATVVVGLVAILDTLAYEVAETSYHLFANDAEAARLGNGGSAEAVCAGCKVLWHEGRVWLLGQPRTEWSTCLYGLGGLDFAVSTVAPDDFPAYARLVDPARQMDGLEFLSWQYPRQRFGLVELNGEGGAMVSTAVEDNRMGARGIYTVHPIFTDLSDEWPVRIRTYKNLLSFLAGSSPHCRTDLTDDPYFQIVHGQRAQAAARLSSLPPERQAFLRQKLAAPEPPKPDEAIPPVEEPR